MRVKMWNQIDFSLEGSSYPSVFAPKDFVFHDFSIEMRKLLCHTVAFWVACEVEFISAKRTRLKHCTVRMKPYLLTYWLKNLTWNLFQFFLLYRPYLFSGDSEGGVYSYIWCIRKCGNDGTVWSCVDNIWAFLLFFNLFLRCLAISSVWEALYSHTINLGWIWYLLNEVWIPIVIAKRCHRHKGMSGRADRKLRSLRL